MYKFVLSGNKMKDGKVIVPGGQAKCDEDEEEPEVEQDSPPTPELSVHEDKTQDISTVKAELPVQLDNADYVNPWDLKKLKLLDNTLNWQEMWNPRHSMSITHTKGLLNAPGENNCFLNSAVQVLWHLDVFRRSFRLLTGHACMGNSCIFCALKVIFTQFQFSDRSALPPDALRKALAKTFADQQRFQLGLMDDAAECFENILLRIHFHLAHTESEDMCNAPHCIPHQMFTMRMVEQTSCQCGATSEPLPFNQMVHYVSTSALVTQARTSAESRSGVSFGHLLRCAISQGDYRNCPSECGRTVQLKRNLLNTPDVISMGLIWDSDKPSAAHIADVVRSIGTEIKLNQLFHSVSNDRWAESSPLQLVGVVCYYGKHYSTFLFHSKMKTWVSFDDANVKEMGSDWHRVVEKCCRGHYQPLLLLYANPNAGPIDTSTALQKPVMLPGHQFNNNNHNESNESANSLGPSPTHGRQRSSDGSGTLGGRSQGGPSYQTSLQVRGDQRRAITPTPNSNNSRNLEVTASRRAVTPGPDWGRYHSDDEELNDNKEGIVHFRQPSYIFAVDGDETPCTCGDDKQLYVGEGQMPPKPQPLGNITLPSAQRTGPGQGSSYNVRQQEQNRNNYVKQGVSSGVDLLGSIPKSVPQQPQQTTTYTSVYNRTVQTAMPAVSYGATSDREQQYYTQEQFLAMERNRSNFVTPSAPVSAASSMAKVNEIQRTTNHSGHSMGPNQEESYQMRGYPQYNGSQNYVHFNGTSASGRSTQQQEQEGSGSSNIARGIMDSNPNMMTPGMKRSKSMENGELFSGQQSIATQRTAVSRHRPQSARPYDYNNSRPTVDPHTGAIIMPQRPRRSSEGTMLDEPDYMGSSKQINDPTDTYSKHGIQAKANSNHLPNGYHVQEEDNYGTYISRKTVQNILQHQGINKRSVTPSMPVQANVDPPATSSKRLWQQNEFLKDLKVDIPDNASIGSHKDSGYRSGGSSGDRNSASSGSSVSMESPTVDQYGRAYPPNSYRHPQPSVSLSDDRCHSSTESLSSSQSGQSYATLKTVPGQQRLNKIPENISAMQKSTNLKFQSAENLLDIPREKAYHNLSQDNLLSPVIMSAAGSVDERAETLFMEAESLLEISNKKEKEGDSHMAMVMCNKAIGKLQQILTLHGLAQDTLVRVRMRHNTSILRSRKLHKQILQRQTSTGSSISTEDQISLSSASSETSGSNKDTMALEFSRNQPPQEKVDNRYDRPQPTGYGYQSGSQGYNEVYPASSQGCHSSQNYLAQSGVPRSRTDGDLEQHSRQGSRDHSQDSVIGEEVSPDRQANIYGTLPKKGKQNHTRPAPNNRDTEVYQAYLQRQKAANQVTSSTDPQPNHHTQQPPSNSNQNGVFAKQTGKSGLEINHQRQWSKEEIRELLVKDFINRDKTKTEPQQPHPQPQQSTFQQPHPQSQQSNFPQPHPQSQQSNFQIQPPHPQSQQSNSQIQQPYPQSQQPNHQIPQKHPQTVQPHPKTLQPQPQIQRPQSQAQQPQPHMQQPPQQQHQQHHQSRKQGNVSAGYEEMIAKQVSSLSINYRDLNDNQPNTVKQQQKQPRIPSDMNNRNPYPQPALKPQQPQAATAKKPLPSYEEHAKRYPVPDRHSNPIHPNITTHRGQYAPPSPFFSRRPVENDTNRADLMENLPPQPGFDTKHCIAPESQKQWMANSFLKYEQQSSTSASQQVIPPMSGPLQKSASYAHLTSTNNKSDALRPDLSNNPPGSTAELTVPSSMSISDRVSSKARFVPCPVAPPMLLSDSQDATRLEEEEQWPPPPPECLLNNEVNYSQPPSDPMQSAETSRESSECCCGNDTPNSNSTSCTHHGLSTNEPPKESSAPVVSNLPPSKTSPAKSVLVKKKRKGKSRKERRSVTFSDNICLIGTPDDQEEPTDYMAIIQKMLERRKERFGASSLSSLSSSSGSSYGSSQPTESLSSDSPKPTRKKDTSGNDSDFDEHLSDSECGSDVCAKNTINNKYSKPKEEPKVRCTLCCRKFIIASEMYCRDCSFYMSKFQPSAAS